MMSVKEQEKKDKWQEKDGFHLDQTKTNKKWKWKIEDNYKQNKIKIFYKGGRTKY